MELTQYKLSFFAERSQYILMDMQGRLLRTDSTLFEIPSEKSTQLFLAHPFFESIPTLLDAHTLSTGDLHLEAVHLGLFGYQGVFDLVFTQVEQENQPAILLLLYDFTRHYSSMQSVQQSRNEAELERELLELRQELLELKNQELERMQEFRMELFAKISHEFRTPVNGILGLSSLLNHAELTPEQMDYLRALETCSNQLLATVNDLLDFSKIEMGKLHFEAVDFNLRELVSSLMVSFAFTAKEKGLNLDTQFGPHIPTFIRGDRLRLSQIIFNLLGNAVKFTQRGKISLKVEWVESLDSPAHLRFLVTDTGIGIPEVDLPHIFEPYFQSGKSTARKYGGTGLGLNIVKQLVERQGGSIAAESEINRGTTIAFTLPFEIPQVEAARPARVNLEGRESANILLIEDSIINQKVVAEILGRRNHTVYRAGSGEEGLALLKQETIDLVITDFHLPGMNGLEVLTAIRQLPAGTKIPVIALSGSDTVDRKLSRAAYRFDKLLIKPVAPEVLLRTVDQFIPNQENIGSEPEAKLVHLEYLHEVAGNNTGLIVELIDIFVEKVPNSLKEMERLAGIGEWQILKEVAHQTKANLRYMGIRTLADLTDQIEKKAEAKRDLLSISEMLKELRQGCEQAIEELTGYRQSM